MNNGRYRPRLECTPKFPLERLEATRAGGWPLDFDSAPGFIEPDIMMRGFTTEYVRWQCGDTQIVDRVEWILHGYFRRSVTMSVSARSEAYRAAGSQ